MEACASNDDATLSEAGFENVFRIQNWWFSYRWSASILKSGFAYAGLLCRKSTPKWNLALRAVVSLFSIGLLFLGV